MTQQDREKASDQRPERDRDPVNHHPPEEWRPGDVGDPVEDGPQPPGEPSHGHGGPAPRAPGTAADQHPTGSPPESVERQLSEGPSGPEQAGYEKAGYAPGYGESDLPGAGVGSRPGGSIVAGRDAHSRARHDSDDLPPPGGYGPQGAVPTSWGKVFGLGFGALLLLLLLGAGCMSLAMFTVRESASTTGVSRVDVPGPEQQVAISTEHNAELRVPVTGRAATPPDRPCAHCHT